MRTPLRFAAPLFLLALCAWPGTAAAQWRYPPFYPYPAYRYVGPDSSLRIQVKPKDASVYVDGYFAGKVDDFDGTFQRLRVEPGEHEIVVYLEGFRSLKQRLYLSPNSSRTIEGELDKLPAGAPNDPQPEPSERDRDRGRATGPDDGYRPPPRGPVTRRAPAEPPPPRRGPGIESRQPSSSRYASLSIRVQPGGAVVRIDGERWDGPASNDERLIVQVSEGHHVIEVERDGYDRFTTDIDVQAGETTPVNINLRRR
ncbi:MAG: PEGA domain-containing protein [Vicinamibacterales bacterium]